MKKVISRSKGKWGEVFSFELMSKKRELPSFLRCPKSVCEEMLAGEVKMALPNHHGKDLWLDFNAVSGLPPSRMFLRVKSGVIAKYFKNPKRYFIE